MDLAARPFAAAHRFEVLPFPRAEDEAAAVGTPLTLTVTCSPRHGVDHALECALRLRAHGHGVILHVSAKTVRGSAHLDELLGRMDLAGIRDVFLVGGDGPQPAGPYASAGELLPVLRAHALAPRTIGVGAYPEGHPFISDDVLLASLKEKDGAATYMTSQLCFDADALTRWLEDVRAAGVRLPLFVGVPGVVDRKRLMEISLRVGVGASVSFLRKQRGLRRLLGSRTAAAEHFVRAVDPLVGDPRLGVEGLHWFTFNDLVETARFAGGHHHLGASLTHEPPRAAR